ncbi:MAG TPA: glutathionylspermidine synthase family protein [Bacteroidota bacterium]|nr:glutathionylspermidine synthase family protein [Bacteroidota bacterium]
MRSTDQRNVLSRRSPEPAAKDTELLSWLLEGGIPSLPYTDGKARLSSAPCIVPSRRMKALRTAAAAVGRAYDDLCDILARDPSYLTGFFSLTHLQQMLWYASGSLWHGIARADIFCTTGGSLAVAEVNSDTPSGVDEAFLLGEFAESRFPGLRNPSSCLREAFLSLIHRSYRELRSHSALPTVAIIYPTDIPEDQGMITLYTTWLEDAGFRVILGSPSNVERGENGRATVFGAEIDVLYRHYKADWLCERVNVWKDARRIPDPGPLLRELENIVQPMVEGDLAVVNPFGAVVTQNKLSLAFFHEKLDLFRPDSQETIRRYIPLTKRLSSFEPGALEREKDEWVLKSDYGCEGAEVIVGRFTDKEAWTHALHLAEPAHWVAQRYFQAEIQDSGLIENYGVYLAGGEPAGLYVRLARGVTGTTAIIAPALERPPLARAASHASPSGADRSGCNGAVRRLIRAYTPGERWLPFRMCLLLHSAADPELIVPFENTPGVAAACEAGNTLAGLFAGAEEDLRRSLLIITDLAGTESVALGAQIAREAEVVLQMENIAHNREYVPLRSTLGALVHFAALVEHGQARRPGEPERIADFILDRRRMDPIGNGCDQFNNRHWAYLPSVHSLEELGVDTLLYIHPDGDENESDDLNEDFVQYDAAGIRICHASPLVITRLSHAGLGPLLDATERTPVRRETVFTYMLPRGDEGISFVYNREVTEK